MYAQRESVLAFCRLRRQRRYCYATHLMVLARWARRLAVYDEVRRVGSALVEPDERASSSGSRAGRVSPEQEGHLPASSIARRQAAMIRGIFKTGP